MDVDPAIAALLAAGIPATVAAFTFTAGEVIRGRNARRDHLASVVGELIAALTEIVVVESRPALIRRHLQTRAITRTVAASTAFLSSVKRKDRVFAYWVVQSSQIETAGQLDRVEWSAKLIAYIRLWQMNPRHGRKLAIEELGDWHSSGEA